MKILQIGSYLSPDLAGGAEVSAQNINSRLTQDGHELVKLRWRAGSDRLKIRFRPEGKGNFEAATWRPFPPIETGGRFEKTLFYAMEFLTRGSPSELREAIGLDEFDLVLMHSWRGIGYDLIRCLSVVNLPTVVFLHDYATVCMNKSMMTGGKNCQKLCSQCAFVKNLNRSNFERFEDLAFVGPSLQITKLIDEKLNLPNAIFRNIPNPNRYDIVKSTRNRPGFPTVLGYIGRLEPDKGIRHFMRDFDELRKRFDVEAVIAGEGSLVGEVRAWAEASVGVSYKGFVQRSEISDIFAQLDILMLPSRWAENFPGVAIQAALAGVPVVAFNVGGVGEIVLDGETGILIAPEVGTLAEGVASLLESPDLLRQMGQKGAESASRFSSEALYGRLTRLIDEVVAGKKSRPSKI